MSTPTCLDFQPGDRVLISPMDETATVVDDPNTPAGRVAIICGQTNTQVWYTLPCWLTMLDREEA